jgi:LysM repeat protein
MQSNVFLNLTSQECSADLLPFIKKDLEERLKLYPQPLNEESLKEAVHFTNLKFLKSYPKLVKAALSLIIIVKQDEDVLIAGIGHYKVYAIDDDFTELVFQDPLNTKLEPNLSEEELFICLKNALGRPALPLVHVRKLKRSYFPDLVVADYQLWSQLSEQEIKNHPKACLIALRDRKEVLKEDTLTLRSNKKLLLMAGSASLIVLGSTFFNPLNSYNQLPSELASSTLQSSSDLLAVTKEVSQEVKMLKEEINEERDNLKTLLFEKELNLTNPSKQTNNESAQSPLFHTVSQGESLSTISQKYYGTIKKAKDIYEANKDALPSQNHLKAGTKLVIP